MTGWIGHAGLALDANCFFDAFASSGLDYQVRSESIITENGMAVDGYHANVKDDGEVMGLTSNRYGVIQNDKAFSLLKPFDSLGIHYERAGMTEGGMAFMVGSLEDQDVLGDGFKTYILAMNSFNGKFPLGILITPTRIVCENMFRGLLGNGKDSMFTIRHGRNIAGLIDSMSADTLRHKVGTFYVDFINNIESLASQKVSNSVLERVLDEIYPLKEKDGTVDFKKRVKNDELRQMWIEKYYNVDDNQNFVGTKYGIINAYYDYLSHPATHGVNRAGYEGRKFEKLMTGESVDSKILKIVKAA